MGFIGKQPAKAAITNSDITDGIVTADKLASNAVTTAKINADAVTDAKIADDVVGTEHLTAGEVDTTALGADAVTAAKIADDAISEEHLDATVITGMTELAAEPADTDEFLISDAGTLKRIDYSHIKASPAMEKITTVTASGSSNVVSFDGHFSSTYDKYRIYIQNWRGNDNSHITMRYRIGNAEKSSSHYASVQEGVYRHSNGTISNDNNSVWDGSAIRITPNGADDSSNYFQHCVVDLINPLGTGYKTCTFETALNAFDQTLFIHGIGAGHYFGDTGALSGLSFYISAGNITATIKIYGIKT